MKSDCILFSGCKDLGGYGLKRKQNKLYKAHRLLWIETYGNISEEQLVCHTCDIPACVNINHLFLGTNSDNMKDMYSKGRGNTIETIAKKLNKILAKEIKEALGTHQSIADLYKIDRTMVGKIKRGVCWNENN